MSSRRKWALLILLVLLLLAWLLWRRGGKHGATTSTVTPVTPIAPTPTPVLPAPIAPAPVTSTRPSKAVVTNVVPPLPKPIAPAPSVPVTPPVTVPVTPPVIAPPSEEGLHKELIPRNVTIVRCYYERDVVEPGTTFGFDINGSGFTEQFHQMITVDFDALDVQATDLHLVTANQIHGTVVVGGDATTQYIFPKVLIRNLPVFKAPEPFGVVRPNEVLDIELTSIDDTGQSGHFRVITNLDRGSFKRFHLEPTTPRLEVGALVPTFPFYIDGTMAIGSGLKSGEYGVMAYLGSHELMKKDPLVDVVRPNIGRTGTIENIKASQPIRRPGDSLDVVITGSGFTVAAASGLRLRVDGLETPPVPVTFASAGRMQASFPLPPDAKVGLYGLSILQGHESVHTKKNGFAVVGPNWLGSVTLARPLLAGQSGQVTLAGRDFANDFVSQLRFETDEPGLQLSAPRWQDANTIAIDLHVSTGVAPGDYLLHVYAKDKEVKLPGGQIIKVAR